MSLRKHLIASFQNPNDLIDQYLEDFSDDEMMVRPMEDANHLAWQLGHLISLQNYILGQIRPDAMPPLPGGFGERYTKGTSQSDNPADFHTKSEYLSLIKQQRNATLRLVEELSEEELAADAPEAIRPWVNTVGVAIGFVACTHWLWHAGQWIVVRKSLGKPIVV
ncbi:MAG: DinB family protein [Planctomycetota bacterium]